MKLTKSRVDKLQPNGKDFFVWDDEISGFGIRVSPKGTKTYIIQYRFKGRTQRVTIGRTGSVTADEARKAAKIMFGDIAKGKSPALEAQKNHRSPTLNVVTLRFFDEHVSVKLKPSTQADYMRVVKKHILPKFGKHRIGEITHSDILSLHISMKNTPYRANCVVRVFSKLFNLCEEWGLLEKGSNPCRFVKPYKEHSRNRFLDKTELKPLWEMLDESYQDGTAGLYAINAYKLLILTGCRLSEIQKLKWTYIRGNRVEFPDSKTDVPIAL